jgi:hypothetical protein
VTLRLLGARCDTRLVSWLANLKQRIAGLVDRVDARIDKPAKSRGTFTSGSEQMIDDDIANEKGRSTSNRRSGFGRQF